MKKGLFLSATAITAMLVAQTASADERAAGQPNGEVILPQDVPAPQKKDGAESESVQDNGLVPEIIVTAQRRNESVQSVPIAISAFSSEQLQSQGVSSTLQLGSFVPNLLAQNNTGLGSANAYYLRGLGSVDSIATSDPPVGTYVDDIYLSRQNANNVGLFDVERVEVLRGPQGTLFGRNTTGGAINVIMRDPGNTFGGYAEAGYGSYNKKIARGSVDIPLAPTFAVKISGYWQDGDGYVKNTTTGERLNDDDGWGVRLGIKGELNANSTFSASYAHIVADGENLLNYQCDPANPSNCDGRFATTGYTKGDSTTRFAGLGITGRKATYGLGNHTATDLVTARLNLGLSDTTSLSLITGYVSLDQNYGLDFYDGRSGGPSLANPNPALVRNPRGAFVILTDSKTQQFSQEIKVTGSLGNGLIDYVAGAFYLREENYTDFADVLFGATVAGDRILRNTTDAKAGYTQVDVNVTGQVKLTAGIRYTDEAKYFSITDNRATCGLNCLSNDRLFANGAAIPRVLRTKLWTPRFAANFKPSDNLLFFVSATRGFKSGGWNSRAYTNATLLPFSAEKVWSYEAGVKSDLFDRRVRFNLTGFVLDVKDLQGVTAVQSATGALTFITRNFADYQNKGLEAELTIVPVSGLTLHANAGYQDDHYKIRRNAPAFDIYGVQSVEAQLAACRAALAAGKAPTIANAAGTPVTTPSGANCGAGIVTATGQIATPPRTPPLTLSVGATYVLPVGKGGTTLVPSVNGWFRTDQDVATNNLSIYTGTMTGTNGAGGATVTYAANPYGGTFITGGRSPSVFLVHASLTLFGPDKAWSLAANCNNCFNQARPTSALANTTYYSEPATWMLTSRVRF